MKEVINICSVSGGKDSTALYCLMVEYHGKDFLPIFADTGHEHPVTINYVKNLHHMAGGPKVVVVRADFSKVMQIRESSLRKKASLLTSQATIGNGIDDLTEAARLEERANRMTPTGNQFLDMMIWKNAVPTGKAQFCTEHLKLWPIKFFLLKYYENHTWIMHTGIRSGESDERKNMQPFMWNDFFDCLSVLPMLYNSSDAEFEFLRTHNVPPNPLYSLGNSRVGCYPCIHANKDQLAALPDWVWEKLAYWESNLPGLSWFSGKSIAEVREWCQTSHGGKQYNMFRQSPRDAPSCMTGWIACE